MIILYLLCAISPFLHQSALDKVPVLCQGRVRPFVACKKMETNPLCLALPVKGDMTNPNSGSWVALDVLQKDIANFTPYSDQQWIKIRKAYLSQDFALLKDELWDAYQSIGGTVFKQTERASLKYPTPLQLKLEYFITVFPFLLITVLAYALFLILSFLRKGFSWWFILIPFALHTLFLLFRSAILLRPPVSNLIETALYVPWAAVLTALLLYWKTSLRPLLLASALLATLILPLALIEKGLDNVPAVLNSQFWLTTHVLMVVGSYGLYFLSALLAHLYLIQKKRHPSMEKGILYPLYLGTILLVGGTLLGGVWAAQSWGRFWDWDPKEAWAFISSGVYVIVIHLYHFKRISAVGLSIGSIVGLMAITFTWYGVNTILATGLHSYGFADGKALYYLFYLLIEGIFITFFLYKNWKIEKKEQTR